VHLELIKNGGRNYLVSGFRKAPGILGELLTEEQSDAAMYEALGRATGRLHSLARSYDPEDDSLRRPPWDQIGSCFNPDQALMASHPLIAERRAEVLELVVALPTTADGYGLIHADLHAANFFFDPTAGTITIFDFDDCCTGWYAMDIAMALFDFAVLYPRLEREEAARDLMARYWCAYKAEHDLDVCWIEEIPRFLKLLEIGVYVEAYQAHDPTDTHSWIGKFMKRRRDRIEEAVPYLDVDLARLLREP
jgi:Ser/Thr protein kinase RdoA (MazF antagonist)